MDKMVRPLVLKATNKGALIRLSLCDAYTGFPLPRQTSVVLSSKSGEGAILTVTFLMGGEITVEKEI